MPLGKAPCRGPSVTLDCVEAGELAEVVDGEGGKREMVLVLALLFPFCELVGLLVKIRLYGDNMRIKVDDGWC